MSQAPKHRLLEVGQKAFIERAGDVLVVVFRPKAGWTSPVVGSTRMKPNWSRH